MSLSEWLAIVPAVVALASIVGNIITLLQKKNKTAILGIMSKIPAFVSEAEKVFGAKQGSAKLNWVLTKLQIECVKTKVKLSDEELTQAIESTLETPQKK